MNDSIKKKVTKKKVAKKKVAKKILTDEERFLILDSEFKAFCDKHQIKAIMFGASNTLQCNLQLTSKNLATFERAGLVEINK